MQILPAILPKDFRDLERHVEKVRGYAPIIQVDICDGQFTPLPSWPYKKHDDNFDAIVRQDRGLPFWEDVEYEFDLMVNSPAEVVENYVSAGAARVVLHVESRGDLNAAMDKLSGVVEIGLALNIETPIETIEPFAERITYVQLMGIDRIGFQGQIFDEKVVAKVKAVKAAYPDLEVQIDGGVSLETAPLLAEAGADRLITGSAVFDSEDIAGTLAKLEAI